MPEVLLPCRPQVRLEEYVLTTAAHDPLEAMRFLIHWEVAKEYEAKHPTTIRRLRGV